MNSSNQLTKYEALALSEVNQWLNTKDGIFTRTFEVIGKPVNWIFEKAIPDAVSNTIQRSVSGALEGLKDVSKWTCSDSELIKEAAKQGIEIEKAIDLSRYPLEKLDKIAQSFFSSNKLIAAIQGGGCGFGGLALIAADIPLIFTIAFRSVRQIGSAYGFDMDDPRFANTIISVLGAGSSTSAAAKAAASVDMKITAEALAKGWTFKKIGETTQTGILINILKDRTKGLPKLITKNFTKKKLSQTIPLLGGAIGAGFNYWFIANTTNAAYMLFRQLYLRRSHGDIFGNNYEVNLSVSMRCLGNTKNGQRCKNQTKNSNGYCHLHIIPSLNK